MTYLVAQDMTKKYMNLYFTVDDYSITESADGIVSGWVDIRKDAGYGGYKMQYLGKLTTVLTLVEDGEVLGWGFGGDFRDYKITLVSVLDIFENQIIIPAPAVQWRVETSVSDVNFQNIWLPEETTSENLHRYWWDHRLQYKNMVSEEIIMNLLACTMPSTQAFWKTVGLYDLADWSHYKPPTSGYPWPKHQRTWVSSQLDNIASAWTGLVDKDDEYHLRVSPDYVDGELQGISIGTSSYDTGNERIPVDTSLSKDLQDYSIVDTRLSERMYSVFVGSKKTLWVRQVSGDRWETSVTKPDMEDEDLEVWGWTEQSYNVAEIQNSTGMFIGGTITEASVDVEAESDDQIPLVSKVLNARVEPASLTFQSGYKYTWGDVFTIYHADEVSGDRLVIDMYPSEITYEPNRVTIKGNSIPTSSLGGSPVEKLKRVLKNA